IDAAAPPFPIGETEPNDALGEGNLLGEVVPGDVAVASGSVSASTDASDVVLVPCPSAGHLRVSLPIAAFSNFDVHVVDVTDFVAPVSLATFASTTANPETGALDVGAGTLLAIEVHATSGAGAWTLTLAGDPPPVALAALVARSRSLAPASLERVRARRPLPERATLGAPRGEVVGRGPRVPC